MTKQSIEDLAGLHHRLGHAIAQSLLLIRALDQYCANEVAKYAVNYVQDVSRECLVHVYRPAIFTDYLYFVDHRPW